LVFVVVFFMVAPPSPMTLCMMPTSYCKVVAAAQTDVAIKKFNRS